MKNKKNIILGIIVGMLLGVILTSSITVYAYSCFANQVTYKDGKNVENALNELYTIVNGVPNTVTLIQNVDEGNSSISFTPSNEYKYYILTSLLWYGSQTIYDSIITSLSISTISNASYIECGITGRNAGSSSGATRSYIIIPNGSGNSINITYNLSDGTCIYGVK